jgi:hypothetical protein
MLRYVLACALALASPLAVAAKPTDAQVDRLLVALHSRALLESTLAQVEANQRRTIDQILAGRTPTEQERQTIERVIAVSNGYMREEMTWDKMAPMFRKVYADSLDSADVEAMIAFYESTAGQHVIEKMPVIAQKTMSMVQDILVPLMQRMQRDMAADLDKTKVEAGQAEASGGKAE